MITININNSSPEEFEKAIQLALQHSQDLGKIAFNFTKEAVVEKSTTMNFPGVWELIKIPLEPLDDKGGQDGYEAAKRKILQLEGELLRANRENEERRKENIALCRRINTLKDMLRLSEEGF